MQTDHPELASQLRKAPFEAILILARWSAYDLDGAMGAAHRVAGRKLSVNRLKKEERLARNTSGVEISGKASFLKKIGTMRGLYWRDSEGQLDIADQLTVEKEFEKRKMSEDIDWMNFVTTAYDFGGLFADPTPDERRNHRVDLFAGSEERRVALLAVGPYSTRESYVSRYPDWLLKSVGVAKLHNRSALILPRNCPSSFFQKWLKDKGPLGKLNVYLVREIRGDQFEAIGDEPIDDLADVKCLENDVEDEAAIVADFPESER
jgi:hypothetical protein